MLHALDSASPFRLAPASRSASSVRFLLRCSAGLLVAASVLGVPDAIAGGPVPPPSRPVRLSDATLSGETLSGETLPGGMQPGGMQLSGTHSGGAHLGGAHLGGTDPGEAVSDPGDDLFGDSLEGDDELELDDLLDLVDEDPQQLSRVSVPAKLSGPVSAADTFHTVVSTVERKESTIGQTPAAVFVITNDMIRRSGVRTIPEALRLAPGVEVARIDANKWAISIRGFNSRFANKLLVQIDGRSVYNPLFGGTFWDVQDVLLEDVDRIEVVRGPGGTVWGNNAVNGVINVITKPTEETTGSLFQAGGGDLQGGFTAVRQGGQLSNRSHYRGYVKYFDRNSFGTGVPFGSDNWSQLRGGGRIDTQWSAADRSTVQGDFYTGYSGTAGIFAAPSPAFARLSLYDENVGGGNVLFRHEHTNHDDSSWQFLAYVDRTDRNFTDNRTRYQRTTYAVDFQHRFSPRAFHDVIWGCDYTFYDDEFTNQPFFLTFDPAERSFDNVSAFVQDTITLYEDVSLTVGSKVSHNDFTGLEVQPSARLLWTPTETVSMWGSVSRAVRTAVRVNEDARLVFPSQTPPVFPVALPNDAVESENLTAYELGYRNQLSEHVSLDAAAFYNRYDDLVGLSAPAGFGFGREGVLVPLRFVNGGHAESWGGEVAVTTQLTDWWLLRGNWSHLQLDVTAPSTSSSGDSPRNQFLLWSSFDLGERWQLDVTKRYVGDLPNQGVDSYFTADVRLGWTPSEQLELFVVGRNLLDSSHAEFGNDPFAGVFAREVPREVYAGLTVRF